MCNESENDSIRLHNIEKGKRKIKKNTHRDRKLTRAQFDE